MRQLERQIDSRFYARTLLSKYKRTMLEKGGIAHTTDVVSHERQSRNRMTSSFST